MSKSIQKKNRSYRANKLATHFCVLSLILIVAFANAHAQSTARAIPLGLPPLPPQDERTQRQLVSVGKRLFFDSKLSANATISCSKCHNPKRYFADGKARGIGPRGQVGTRNTPSLLNVAYATQLFWDGRSPTLEDQARFPLLNPLEHGFASDTEIEARVNDSPIYRDAFLEVVGKRRITRMDVTNAIAAYERTLLSGASPFDRFFYGKDLLAMSPSAIRGLALFRGRGHCDTCHTIGTESALFTDSQFHHSPLGLPETANARLLELTKQVVQLREGNQVVVLNSLIISDFAIAALGRFLVTLNPQDIGLFKTPSLRNVALTAPFFHDGSVRSLDEAVGIELYLRGDEVKYPIVVSSQEKRDLIEFLMALSST